MIYISHLTDDIQMKNILKETGAGLECIEFSVSDNLDRLDERLPRFEKRLKEMNVSRLTLHGPFLDLNPASYDSHVAKVTRLRFEQAYAAARKLGADKLVLHTGFIYRVHLPEGWAGRTADFFNEFLEGKSGITVCLENVYDPVPRIMIEVKKRVRSSDFSLCLDIGHAHCNSDVPLDEWIEAFAPYTTHIHVHDNDKSWDNHQGLGKGTIDLGNVMPLLKSSIPDASVTIECSEPGDILTTYRVLKDYGF